MPSIVVVIDEIADIMISNKPEVMEPQFVRFFQAYQRVSDVHFIIGSTTSGNFSKWLTPLMVSHLGMNKIMLRVDKDDYKIFPDIKDKLVFDDSDGRVVYYINAYSKETLKKFRF